MRERTSRSWRFVLPDFDAATMPAGLNISNTGGIAMVEEEQAVRQAILLLLTTTPGERVMRPTYGCDLKKLLFSPNDTTTHGLAIHYVRQAIQRWESRIDIIQLDAGSDPSDAGRINIVLDYRTRRTGRLNTLTLPVYLSEETP